MHLHTFPDMTLIKLLEAVNGGLRPVREPSQMPAILTHCVCRRCNTVEAKYTTVIMLIVIKISPHLFSSNQSHHISPKSSYMTYIDPVDYQKRAIFWFEMKTFRIM